jgi:hypothetical protein
MLRLEERRGSRERIPACRPAGLSTVEAHAILVPALEGFSPTPEMPMIAEAKTCSRRSRRPKDREDSLNGRGPSPAIGLKKQKIGLHYQPS